MGGADDELERAAYGRVRRILAIVLAGFVGLLIVADVLDAANRTDPIVLGLLLGALLVLLGVEAGSRLLP
jgi:hypothetical protein